MTIDQVIAIIGQAATWLIGKMTIDRVIAIIGQIATWITVLVVFWTLREMARQRRQSLQPELVIPRVVIHGGIPNSYVPIDWAVGFGNKDATGEPKLKRRDPNLTIYNLGIGAATNINLHWDFDLAGTLRTANELCQKHSIPILFKIDGLGETVKLIDNSQQILQIISTENPIKESTGKEEGLQPNSATRVWIDVENDQHVDYDYLLPVSVNGKGLSTNLPTTYTALISIPLCFSYDAVSEGITSFSDVKISPLKLELKYNDISGTHYVKKLEATCSLYQLSYDKDTPFRTFTAALEFKLR